MSKFIIVTADDFGLHDAINAAVHQASVHGVLTAASLMVGAPASEDAVRRARELPRLRVGLHLVMADGVPVLPRRSIPALVDQNGRFRDQMWADGVRYFALRTVRRQLEAEIRAQFTAFAATGLLLDHVNAHKHFHLHPTLLGLILQVGHEFGMRSLRVPDEPLWFARRNARLSGVAGAALLSPWATVMRRRLRAEGIACNDRVFGISCSGALTETVLLSILARLPPGVTEIYLHPATSWPSPITPSMAEYRHRDELDALLSVHVADALHATRALTGGYSDVVQRFTPEGARRARRWME